MEEILALLIQFLLEVGLQLVGSLGIDWVTESARRRKDGEAQEHDGCGWLVAFAVSGAVCGVISLFFAPRVLLPSVGLRIANLVLAPLIAGGLSYLVAAFVWVARGQDPWHHFWRGFWFALLFGIVRFVYAGR